MPAKKPYISVVIPTYNRAGFIGAAIDSVLGQKKAQWPLEIIVVDDGSTDNTAEVVKAFGAKIRYFKIPHSGLPAVARNFGIAKARGELIAFQDSDDIWTNDKLVRQIPLFDDPKVILSYAGAVDVDETGQPPKHTPTPTNLKQGENFNKLVKTNIISTLTVVARKAALVAAGGFNEAAKLRAMEDYELWLRMSAFYPDGLKAVPVVLAYRRLHANNISSYDALVSVERIIAVYEWLWDHVDISDSQKQTVEKELEKMQENWSRLKNEVSGAPAVTVVMGIYKDKAFVKDAVQSILDQTFTDFEFIIIDDGSTDGSYDIVKKFKDPRIRIIRQTNHGLVEVLNKGVRLARASLIARQDADDISLPKRLEKEIGLMRTNDRLAIIGTFFRYVDEKTLKPTGITITTLTKHLDVVRHMYFDNPIGHGTALIRRQAIIEAGGYTDKYGPNEDYALWRKIVDAGWQVNIIPEVYYLYRTAAASGSRTGGSEQHQLFVKLLAASWRGPIYFKPFWAIVSDSFYYRWLESPFRHEVYHQYKSQQARLSFELLVHGKLVAGYNNFIGTLLIYPTAALRMLPTALWAPIKYMREFR